MQLDLCIMLIFVKIDNGMFNTAKKITDKLTNKIKEEGLSLIVIFSLFLVSLFLFKFKMVNLFIDFGREITVPKSMINGQVLYKDIFCLYGPFSYLFNAFALKLTKIHLTTFHILGWINTFLILNGIYFISRNFLNKTLSSLITIFVMWVCAFVPFVTNYITPYSYATVYGLCSITLSVIFLYKFIDKDKNIFLYLSFLLSGIAFANKFEYLFCLIVTLTACIYKKCKIKYYIFGLTIWLLPTLLCYFLLFIQGLTIQDYKNYFEIILRYINTPSLKEFYAGTMTFSLTPFLTESVMFLVSAFIFGAIYKTAKGISQKTADKKVKYLFYCSVVLATTIVFVKFELYPTLLFYYYFPLLLIILSLIKIKLIKNDLKTLLLILTAISISSKSLFLLNTAQYGRYFLPFLTIALVVVLRNFFFKNSKEIFDKSVIILLSALIFSNFIINTKQFQKYTSTIKTPYGNVITSEKNKKIFDYILDFLNTRTKTNDKVVVLRESTSVNFLSNRDTDNYYNHFDRVSFDAFGEENILKHYQKNRPDYFVIFTSQTDNEYFCRGFGQKICGWINQNYEIQKIIQSDPFVLIFKKI